MRPMRPGRWCVAAVVIVSFLCIAQLAGAQAFDVVHAFAGGGRDAALPMAGLLRASDGNFYGTTSAGGLYGYGTVFKMTPSGVVSILYDADIYFMQPRAALVQGTDGRLFGTTIFGFTFRINSNGTGFTRLGPLGGKAYAPQLQASNGSFIASFTHQNGQASTFAATYNDSGVTGGTFGYSSIISAGHSDGVVGPLIEASDGNFYGTFSRGGAADLGVVFRMTPAGAFAVVHEFDGEHGALPRSLIQAADGNFYGLTEAGGAFNLGTAFTMTPAGSVSVLHTFTGDADGSAPKSPLLQTADGSFYDTAEGGAFGRGVTYRIRADGALTVLHAFTGGRGDGADPASSALIQDGDGTFFGTTKFGGEFGCGTAFRMTAVGAITILHSFGACEGSAPQGTLVQAADGNLLGTTTFGGGVDRGTVFETTPTGDPRFVQAFGLVLPAIGLGSMDGKGPVAGLIRAADGTLYGTTVSGGGSNRGTAFRVDPANTLTVTLLHEFQGPFEGGYPRSGLLQAVDGNFYGTTSGNLNGGVSVEGGTVYRMTATGVVTVLHTFVGGAADGRQSEAALIQASDGNLYGTTRFGGAFDRGTIFRITPAGLFTLLYSFAGGLDGEDPRSALVQASDGNLYGTTSINGAYNAGTAFSVTLGGSFTILHQFAGGRDDGAYPQAGLIQAHDGLLYGTTAGGGAFGIGTVFRMAPDGRVTVLAALNGSTDGSGPVAGLIQARDGHLYGVAASGGPFGHGVMFRVRLGAPSNPVTGVSVRSTANGPVRLSWNPGATATSYMVTRWSTSGEKTIIASGLTATAFTDTTAVPGQRYYYVVTAVNGFGEAAASSEVAITAGASTRGDFDGDRKADPTIYRPSTAGWWSLRSTFSSAGYSVFGWGIAGDVPVPGDYDGDGLNDIAVFRPSTAEWWVLLTGTNYATYAVYRWGRSTDLPVPADYDGDGKTDVAIYRPSTATWWILWSSTNYSTYSTYGWGVGGDIPVPADYDGDGKVDIAVYRPSTAGWWILRSSGNYTTYNTYGWGLSGDIPVAADYDGDGSADVAVYRPSTGVWWILESSTNNSEYTTRQWGLPGDVPVPADYDGDGKTDLAIYRPATGEWWLLWSSTNGSTYNVYSWGLPGDVPALKTP